MNIGDRIKKSRLDKNMTQEELAKIIHSTKQTIYKYENGIIDNIPSDKIEKIASVLDTTPAYLMGWEEDKTSSEQNNENVLFAKNKEEKELILLCRKVEDIPEEQKQMLIDNFKQTIDIYMQAKGLK